MNYYAVIDTNVLVSALLKSASIPGIVARESLEGQIIPLLNDEIIAEYQDDIMAYVKEYDALREEYGTLGRLAFRRRREILDRLATRADAIKAINKRYEHYDFIDFITFELPDDEG